MKNVLKIIRALLFILIITICLPTCITVSQKSWISHSKKYENNTIGKLFVLINLPKNIKYATKFEEQLQEQLAERDIHSKAYKIVEFDLTSDHDISKMMSDYKPTHVMNMYIESTYNDNEVIKETKYRLVIINATTGQKVWDGTLNQVLGTIKKTDQEKNDVKTVLEELEKNQLIKNI